MTKNQQLAAFHSWTVHWYDQY